MKKILSSLVLAIFALTGAVIYNTSAPKAQAAYYGQDVSPSIKNRIMNGDMRISQRGTSFSASTGYTLDRWRVIISGSVGAATITQSTTVPSNAEVAAVEGTGRTFKNSLRVDVTTIDASVDAADVITVRTGIEGSDITDIVGDGYNNGFTYSFWVRATKTGAHYARVTNSGNDRTYVSAYTVNTTNTWEKKKVTVLAAPSGGTWNTTNGVGLLVDFPLLAGANWLTTANAWQSNNYYAVSGVVNDFDSTANDFYITGVQLEPGANATPFEFRSVQQEFAMCQRYCVQFDSDATGTFAHVGTGDVSSTTGGRINVVLPVPMRTRPALSQSAVSDLLLSSAADGDAATALSLNTAVVEAQPKNVRIDVTVTASAYVAGQAAHLVFNNGASKWLRLDADF